MTDNRAPRVGHKKSRKGCAQCKRRHVKCNEDAPCSNCIRHGVACSLAGGPYVPREDATNRRTSAARSTATTVSRTTSQEAAASAAAAAANTPVSARASPSSPGPLAVLTGLIDRPLPGQTQNWMLDLQLLHHYLTHTKYILPAQSDVDYTLRIWRDDVPKVAFRSEYVMHGLLGFSALHKARVETERAQYLRTNAVNHLDQAILIYKLDHGPATAENANAKFLFSWIIALFAYAIPPSVPPIDAIVELLRLVRGIDSILAETWYWVAQGPFAPLLSGGPSGESITLPAGYALPEGMDFGLAHLDYMLGVDAMMPEDRRICAVVLNELKQIYDGVWRTQGNTSLAAILIFPKQDSIGFSGLIKRRVPQALIILAYYCVLWDILDTRWWMHGWAARGVRDILGVLEEQWRTWIEWPVQNVLLKERPPPVTLAPVTSSILI